MKFGPYKRTLAVAAFAGLVALSGCKLGGGDSSDVKTLDNFARKSAAPVTNHLCSGGNEVISGLKESGDAISIDPTLSASMRSDLSHAMDTALSAVPTNLQLLFVGLGGKIVVGKNTDANCRGRITSDAARTFASEGQTAIKSCWDVDEGLLAKRLELVQNYQGDGTEQDPAAASEASKAPITIYVNADAKDVRHATVRIFSYILSQVLVTIADSGNGSITLGASNDAFTSAKVDLANALLADVKRNSKYDLSLFRRIAQPDSREFQDYVFAEAFDSWYCNAETRSLMASDFSTSHGIFAAMAAELEDLDPGEIAGQDASTSSSASDAVAATDSGMDEGSSAMALTGSGFGLRFFGGFFRGVARVAFGVARFAGRVAVGAVRVGARIVGGVVRVGAALVRGAVRVGAAVVRGALIVGGRIVRGVARLAVGAARVVLSPGWAWYDSHGGAVFGYPTVDYDTDGQTDLKDACTGTASGAAIWKDGRFAGCAGGQYVDRGDRDGDGVVDSYDLCRGTPRGAAVWSEGPWAGCAGGQYRNPEMAYQ
jgi:hypothetical protein